MADERQTGKDLEGSSLGLNEVIFRHLSGRPKKSHEKPGHDIRCPYRDMKPAPPE
jgi:hypothetical protein